MISLQQKRELVEELINDFQKAEYSKEAKQELLTQTQIKLQFIKPESTQEIMMSIQGPAMVRVVGRRPEDTLRRDIELFEKIKARGISQFKALLTEIDLSEKFNTHEVVATSQEQSPKTKVFIVHGHDEGLKNEVARFIEQLGLEAIILHEQVSRNQTIIEKIESYSNVGFSIVLYTPCDVGKSVSATDFKPRARQNVIFEHGYFVAKLGRENVVALKKGDVEEPNDLSGVIYVSYDRSNWKRDIAHELHHSGYVIDFSKV